MWTDRSRLLVTGAAISLLLNVFLVGLVAGHFSAIGRHLGAGRVGGQAGHVDGLTPEQRHQFMTAMTPHRPAIRAAREAHRAQRAATEADIAAATYDRAKVTADFAALRKATGDVSEAVDTALVDALASLPPEARSALVAHGRFRPAPPPHR